MFKSFLAMLAIVWASIFGGHQIAAPSQPAAVVSAAPTSSPSASQSGAALTNTTPDISVTHDPEASPTVTPPVPTVTNITVTGVSEKELTAKLANLSNSLQLLVSNSVKTPQLITTFTGNTIPPNLTSPLTAADIPTDITASNYLSLGGGTLTGALLNSSAASSSFLGALGIGTTSPSDVFAVNGPIYLADISPSATANRLYANSGDLYWAGSLVGGGSVGNWTTSGGNVYRASGNVGVGTTSPFTNFAVEGNGYFGGTLTTPNISATNSTTSALGITGGINLSGNLTYTGSGTSSPANSWLFQSGTIAGTAAQAPDGFISPYNLFISGDSVDTRTRGNGSLNGFTVFQKTISGFTGSRNAFLSDLAIHATPADSANATYSSATFLANANSNLGGTSGAYTNYKGGIFGANPNVFLSSGATNIITADAEENDITVPVGANVADKFGLTIVQGVNDANRGDYDDAGIEFGMQTGAATTWHYGISFGGYASGWDFATDSTLIIAQTRQAGGTTNPVALNGVDFRNVTFTPGGYAFASPGFSVSNGGAINTSGSSDGYLIDGALVLQASSTNSSTLVGFGAGSNLLASTTLAGNTAVGFQALLNETSSSYDTALGYLALKGSAAISSPGFNTAIGYKALSAITTGNSDVALGYNAGSNLTSGIQDVYIGAGAGQTHTSGNGNIYMGYDAGQAGTTASNNTCIGSNACFTNTGGNSNTVLGATAGYNLVSGSSQNIILGSQLSSGGLTTAKDTIEIGDSLQALPANAYAQLDIGNLIFATGLASTTAISTGNVGIGTSSPTTALQVNGVITPNADNTSSLGNSTYHWSAVYSTNNVIQTSDARLKGNVATTTYGLDQVMQLRPVSFTWKAQPQQGTQLGFIAQEVQPILPETVNIGDDANHTLGLTYTEFIPVIVKAVQDIANITSTFQQNLIAWLGNASNGITDLFAVNGHFSNELCVGSTCVTPAQFQAMVAAANQSPSAAQPSPTGGTNPPESVTQNSASSTPPTIIINGDNPATITIGDTYADLGATVSDTGQGQAGDPNLGFKYFLNGALVSNIVLDTSAVATDTVDYVATDTLGNTATSTRTVIVEAQASSPPAVSSATTSAATSTTQ